MDFFGFGASADLSTPTGQMIKSGTDSLLIGPDWSKNLEICDHISNTKEGPEHAVKAIVRRLQDSDHNTVYLALIMLETCFKNCGVPFVAAFDKYSMEEVVNLAKGSKGERNAQESLRLIQQWGRRFETSRGAFPLYFDTFMGMKSKGFPFPREETFEQPPSSRDEPSSRSQSNTNNNRPQPQQKQPVQRLDEDMEAASLQEGGRLERDLQVVSEKVKLCREMLLVSPGIRHDETLSDVIGFLEACRDRLSEVIEAGTQGLLDEALFESCLKVNDAVLRTLDAERNGTPIAVDEDDSRKQQQSGEESKKEGSQGGHDLLDMGFDALDNKAPIKVVNTSSASHSKKSAVLTASSLPVVPSSSVADAFDPFATKPPAAAPATHFDPFQTQQPPPQQPATDFDPFADPAPVKPSPTPFDDLLSMPVPVNATPVPPAAAPGAMTDADFDSFFNDLDKK